MAKRQNNIRVISNDYKFMYRVYPSGRRARCILVDDILMISLEQFEEEGGLQLYSIYASFGKNKYKYGYIEMSYNDIIDVIDKHFVNEHLRVGVYDIRLTDILNDRAYRRYKLDKLK